MDRAAAAGVVDVLEALPVAVVLSDEEHRVIGWNTAATVLYGHAPTDALGSNLVEVLFEAEDRTSAAIVLGEAAAGAAWEGDFRVRRADGVLLVSSFRAAPVTGGVAWIATDGMDQGLAEQQRNVLLSAERAARDTAEEALSLLEAILGSAPVGIAVVDLDLQCTRVNEAFAEMTGIPAAQHLDCPFGDLVPFPPQVGADLRRVVTTGRSVTGRAVELPGAEPGSPRHLTASAFPIRNATGAVVGAGLTTIDVTEIRRAIAERAAVLQLAESAQERLAILATASTVLTTTMELDELLARLAQVLAPGAADWCVIELVDTIGRNEHVAVSHRDRERAAELEGILRSHPLKAHATGAVATVLRTGQAMLLQPDRAQSMMRAAALDRDNPSIAERFAVHSSVIVPIQARGEQLGVLILSTDGDRVLNDDDLDLAVEVAHRASLAVGNARAFQNEHQIAESLQRALLPASLPEVPELDVAVRYVAATDGASVGGDWYDVITFDDSSSIGLVVGDVIGHDISAATSMGQLRTVVRASIIEDQTSPAAALTRVDRLFGPLDLPYATCILAMYDPATATLRWSNAGHLPPLLVHQGERRYLEDGRGVMLGIGSSVEMGEASTQLQPGDTLVLYTDGLVERRGESLTDGLDRLAAGASTDGGSAGALADALLARLLPPTEVRGDDVALIVVRVRDADAPRHTYRLDLSEAAYSAATARGFTAGVLDRAGLGELIDTAVLLVSELVTNALSHGAPPYALVVDLGDDAFECRVEDGAPSLPQARAADDLSESGRGLLLVDALASAWGTETRGAAGKTTWFRLALPDAG